MRKLRCFVMAAALFAILASCSTLPVMRSVDPAFPAINAWLEQSGLAITSGCGSRMDFESAFAQGVVLACGEGLPVASATVAGQKRITAERAAVVVAQRNLAAFIAEYARGDEIRFDSYTVRLDAFVKGAEQAVSEYSSGQGKALALVKLDLKGAKGFAK